MKISKRLQVIGDVIPDGCHMIDVGCDHALLDIYVVRQNREIVPIASDVIEGPLAQAKKNIAKYHLEDQIDLRLGEGITPMADDTDTVVISGMGGKTMLGIFKYQLERLKQVRTIILSPNNDMSLIRTFLCKQGFKVDKEFMVEDHQVIYPILYFTRGKIRYSKRELLFGPIFMKQRTALWKKYYQKELQRKEILVQLLPKNCLLRKISLQQEIKTLKKIL